MTSKDLHFGLNTAFDEVLVWKSRKDKNMFRNFMKKYIGDVSAKGKLAEDISRDKYFPRNETSRSEMWHTVIKDYLVYDNEACESCIDAFEECWEEYCDA